jgi:hypothetical protein
MVGQAAHRMSMVMLMVLAEPMPVRPAKFAAAAVVEIVTVAVMRGGKVLMSWGAVNRNRGGG